MARPRINLVSWTTRSGLGADLQVLGSAIEGLGGQVFYNGRAKLRPIGSARLHQALGVRTRRAWRGVFRRHPYDLNIFLESISPWFFDQAPRNWFIPNPEWYRSEDDALLRDTDRILCKTRHALEAFQFADSQTRLLGFTSRDLLDSEIVPATRPSFLHVAGKSRLKGTMAVLEAWSRCPWWPRLTIVARPDDLDPKRIGAALARDNVDFRPWPLPAREIRFLQNRIPIHLCPSEAEGYGHVIGEGMSCGATVVTTDAPPMNELVTEECGILLPAIMGEGLALGRRSLVSVERLVEAVETLLERSSADHQSRGVAARTRFLRMRKAFHDRLSALLAEDVGFTP